MARGLFNHLTNRLWTDGTHLIDSTGRHFVHLKLLLQQLRVAVTEWTSYKDKAGFYLKGKMQIKNFNSWKKIKEHESTLNYNCRFAQI